MVKKMTLTETELTETDLQIEVFSICTDCKGFEEINETLGISFSYSWMNSSEFGWIRKCNLRNLKNSSRDIQIVDGLLNILPAGISSKIQNTFGNLLNAYKRSEIDKEYSSKKFILNLED